MINKKWLEILFNIDYAFQPIINPYTGQIFAVEALLRDFNVNEIKSIYNLFDTACKEKVLLDIDRELRKKVFEKFVKISFYKKIKLFYNYDQRIFNIDNNDLSSFETLIKEYNLNNDVLCLEISEKHKFPSLLKLKKLVRNSKNLFFNIALDDFGAGYSGIEIFYHSDPGFLKFDKFLIHNIHKDLKKRTFCSHIINLTKLLGAISIAEGVENEFDFNTCKELGFNLVQGYFIQKPTINIDDITHEYSKIDLLNKRNRRRTNSDKRLIYKQINKMETIGINEKVETLIQKFRSKLQYSLFPVLDSNEIPLGIIHEKQLKIFLYSKYGMDILMHKSINKDLNNLIKKCPVADINTGQEKILEIFVQNNDTEGIIITKDLKYFGFLDAKSLLNIINEKRLKNARELNPLTKLPGNLLINEHIYEIYKNRRNNYILIYFDFDFFKPFNDKFGFRQGDRAIIIFSELLKKEFAMDKAFIGHIGGDDFFLGIESDNCITELTDIIIKKTGKIINTFTETMKLFYDEDEIQQGYYISKDREGKLTNFNFLSATAVVIFLNKGKINITDTELIKILSDLKKEAKIKGQKIMLITLNESNDLFTLSKNNFN